VAIDDAREALFSQTFQVGYLPRQPPLYNWLAWAGVRVLGVSAAALIVCRYLTLGLAYLFLYLSAVRVLGSRRLALLAAFSLLLMGPFNWDVHEELTHSLAALAAAAATFYAMLRVERSGHPLAYVGLGTALAAGFLAKFSYGFFAGSLFLAALATPAYRCRVLSPRIALALVTAIVLCVPYALWFIHRELSIVHMFVEEVRPESAVGYLGGVARGFGHLGRMLGIYLMPFALVFPVVFWRAWPRRSGDGGEARRLVGNLLLIELGLVVLGIVAGSLTFLKFRWLMPAFCLVPLLAFAWIDRTALDRRMMRRYAVALAIAEAVVILGLSLNVFRGDALGAPTRLNAPYDLVARTLAEAGFARGTIAAGDGPLAGNLRLHFPDARVVRLTNPDYRRRGPATANASSCGKSRWAIRPRSSPGCGRVWRPTSRASPSGACPSASTTPARGRFAWATCCCRAGAGPVARRVARAGRRRPSRGPPPARPSTSRGGRRSTRSRGRRTGRGTDRAAPRAGNFRPTPGRGSGRRSR